MIAQVVPLKKFFFLSAAISLFSFALTQSAFAQACDPSRCPSVDVYGDGEQAMCRAWASEAVGLQLENEQRSCGYKGGDWHFDIKLHYEICTKISQLDREQFAVNRREQLQKCRDQSAADLRAPEPDASTNTDTDVDKDTASTSASKTDSASKEETKTVAREWEKYCQKSYLVDALKVARTAEKWECSDADQELHLSKERHYNFCMREAPKGTGDYPLHGLIRTRQEKIQECQQSKGVKVTLTREINIRRRACSRFADIYLNATLENKRLKCGQTGADWHDDWNKHYARCAGLERGERLGLIHARQAKVRSCRAEVFPEDKLDADATEAVNGTGSDQVSDAIRNACEQYAKSAVAHQAANTQLGCGFSGALWDLAERKHLDACVSGTADYAFKSNMARGEQLRRCTAVRLCKNPDRAITQFCQDLTGIVPPGANTVTE